MKYIFLVLNFIYFSLFSQHRDSTYYIGVTSTGTYNKTTTNDSYLFNNMLKFSTKRKDVTLNSNNKWLYGQQKKERTNNDFSSSWDVDLRKTFPHFNYWGLLNYNSIYSLKINNQLQTGVGGVQNSFQYKNDYIIRSDVSATLKLKKWLSLTSAFSYNKMSRTNASNLTVTYGIVIENYF